MNGEYEQHKYCLKTFGTNKKPELSMNIHKLNRNMSQIRYFKRKRNPYMRGVYKAYQWVLFSINKAKIARDFVLLFKLDKWDDAEKLEFCLKKLDPYDYECLMTSVNNELSTLRSYFTP